MFSCVFAIAVETAEFMLNPELCITRAKTHLSDFSRQEHVGPIVQCHPANVH